MQPRVTQQGGVGGYTGHVNRAAEQQLGVGQDNIRGEEKHGFMNRVIVSA